VVELTAERHHSVSRELLDGGTLRAVEDYFTRMSADTRTVLLIDV